MRFKPFRYYFESLLCIVLVTATGIPGCHTGQRDKANSFALRFQKGDDHSSISRFAIHLKISKMILVKGRNSNRSDTSKEDVMSLIPPKLIELSRDDKLRSLDFDVWTNNHQQVLDVHDDGHVADLSQRVQINEFRLRANNDSISAAGILGFLQAFLGGEKTFKRMSDGSWIDIPIFGLQLPANDDPFIGRLLDYVRKWGAFPSSEIRLGSTWRDSLHLLVPVDSLSGGTSHGFIKVDIFGTDSLHNIQNDIANIKSNLNMCVTWSVDIPSQGYTKLSLLVEGGGYRLFDMKKGWDHGDFFRGEVKTSIDALTLDSLGRKAATRAEMSGTIDLASKSTD